jgi:hypothetical protein
MGWKILVGVILVATLPLYGFLFVAPLFCMGIVALINHVRGVEGE